MSKYDNYDDRDERDALPQCEHVFNNQDKVITEYSEEICDWLIDYGRHGYHIRGFCGKYNICVNAMGRWLSAEDGKYEEFKSAVTISVSAATHYWNEELIHALKNMNTCGESLPLIRGILSDIMKYTPKNLQDMSFNNLKVKTAEELERENRQKEEEETYNAFRGI